MSAQNDAAIPRFRLFMFVPPLTAVSAGMGELGEYGKGVNSGGGVRAVDPRRMVQVLERRVHDACRASEH